MYSHVIGQKCTLPFQAIAFMVHKIKHGEDNSSFNKFDGNKNCKTRYSLNDNVKLIYPISDESLIVM